MSKSKLLSKKKEEISDKERYSLDSATAFVSEQMKSLSNSSINERGLKTKDALARQRRISRLNQSLELCIVGDINAKQFVKDYILEFLTKDLYGYMLSSENVDYAIPFNNQSFLTVRDKFDTLVYYYSKTYAHEALTYLIKKYKLLDKRQQTEDELYYVITSENINYIYEQENLSPEFELKMDVIVQRIYSELFGLSSVDILHEQAIDGYSGGVSGLAANHIKRVDPKIDFYVSQMHNISLPRYWESSWMFYKGKNVHLKFLGFGFESALERVCTNIYMFGNPGELSQEDGYMVNDMADDSRVVVLITPFCETNCFFVRKFDIPETTIAALYPDDGSADLVELINYQMKGNQTVAITGVQGAGKTTLLFAIVELIYSSLTLRISEMFFEMHARKKHPNRNIVSLREISEKLDGQAALDILKKTDGSVTLIPEVATAKVASYVMQTAKKASLFTVFCHHALTFKELIESLRDDMLMEGSYKSEELAEKRVVNTISFNYNIDKTPEGKRYMSRITECIPIDKDYSLLDRYRKSNDPSERQKLYQEAMIIQVLGQKTYDAKNIMEYNTVTNKYEIKNCMTPNKIREIYGNLMQEDRVTFIQFLKRVFNYEFVEVA